MFSHNEYTVQESRYRSIYYFYFVIRYVSLFVKITNPSIILFLFVIKFFDDYEFDSILEYLAISKFLFLNFFFLNLQLVVPINE